MALGVLVDRDLSIKNAGGMIIQVMPEAKEEDISRLEENIKNITSVTSMLESGMNAEDIIKVALDGFDFHFTEKHEISYKCGCTRERVRKVLKSIGTKEIEDIIKEDGKAELCCQFCPEKYEFDKEELENILDELKTGDD